MPVYEYQGQFYELSETDPAAAKNKILGYLKRAAPRPEPTILGQAKELGKGLIPGAVGLVEQAAIGASALLPEDYEKTAREKIASIAGAAKAPFTAAPGYEETVGRKLGEALGSTVPFLAAGPLGLAGRLGAVGLGVGAGAGEARTRAEKEGATAEQRATATALGIAPGALEVFAPFRILSRIPDAATAQGVQLVKRALIAGGEEAAQEAASGFAQNLIAKGVYKPEQELIEGLGEQAAYGGATGAIIQGLMDLALGRRAKGPRTGAPAEAPIERAEREQAAVPPTPPAPPAEAPAAPESTPPVAEEPTPPVTETPAPPAPPVAEEPKVKKPGEPPAGGMQPADIEALGISKKQPIYRRMLGKDLENPEQRAAVLSDIENYLTRGHGTEESRAKLTAFKEQFVPPIAPPAAEAVPTPPTPTEAPSVVSPTTEPEAGGAGAPVAGEPGAGAAPAGVGVPEPSGVVPPVADAGQPAVGEGQQPVAVAPAPAAPPAPKKVLGSLESRVKALNVNAAIGGVPDLKVIRETLEPLDPKMAQAVSYYLGVDAEGDLLVGANNMPQTPSAQEAGQMAGLGENSGDRVKKVAKALGLDATVIRKFQASQNRAFAEGRSKTASESGTGALLESPESGLIADQEWYKPIAKKGLKQANHTEVARAALMSERFLGNDANLPAFQELMGEVQVRSKRPEFAAAFRSQQKMLAPDETGISRREEDIAPGQEEAVDETGAEDTDEDRYARGVEVESPDLSAEQVKSLEDNDVMQALASVSTDPSADRVHRAVAQRLAPLLDATSVEVQDRLVDDKGRPVLGQALASGEKIRLSRAGGLTQEVLLHEATHAAAERVLLMPENLLTPQQLAAKRELEALHEAVKKDPDITSVDAKGSLTEFVAEVMSNSNLQQQMAKKPWKLSDAMKQFKSIILRLLGIREAQSMLTSAMASVDAIFLPTSVQTVEALGTRSAVGREITPEAKETAKKLDAIGERRERTFTQKVGRQLEGNVALRLREKLADSLAPMEDFFVKAYGGQIRTASGRLNPMVLLSRALDALRVSKAAQIEGGLDRKDGLIVAAELTGTDGKRISYSRVLERIADAAKADGTAYKEYQNVIDNVLYGHREYNLREQNRQIEQQAQALEAAGKAKEANALREGKIDLLLSDAQIDRAEAAFQQDEFIKGVSAELDAIRFNMLDMLVKTGRIGKEQAQDYKDAIGYIPFERIGEYENQWAQATRGANRGAAALKNRRKLEGSDRQSTSVIENFSGLMDWATKEAMKNEAAYRALTDMEMLGAAVRRDSLPKTDAPGDIVTVYEEGKPVKFYVPDPAHLATFSMADPQLSNIIKGLSQATRLLRAGVTSMPPFAIKQIFDDIVRAYTYAGVKNNGELVKNVLISFPRNWFNEVFKRKPAGIRELENLGIVGTFDFTQQTNLRDILRESGAEKEGLGHNILRVMEAGAKASDLAVREAIYKQVMKETGDTAQAESAAREIINFSRRGSSRAMNMMISIIPFFNAYARGMDKLATAAAGGMVGQTTGTARSMFYKRMGVMTAMGLAYALMMSGDDEYEKLPDHVRDTNWVLPYGKELGFTPVIPIPAELAFFFKAIPERVVRYYKYQGTEDERAAIDVLSELTKRGIDVFSSPNLMAQGLRPLVENMVNYSFFLGRPLESQAQLALRPFERYGTGTSEAMKAVAAGLEDLANATGIEAFTVSPIKLENAVRGIFGTSAGIALSLTDSLINPGRTARPVHQQLSAQLTGASAVMKDPVGTRFMDEIYDLEKRTEQVNGTYNRMLKTQPEKADAFLIENIGMYQIRPQVQSLMTTIRSLNEAAQNIDRDKSLSPEERRKLIDQLRAEQNEIARQVWQLRREARAIQAAQ